MNIGTPSHNAPRDNSAGPSVREENQWLESKKFLPYFSDDPGDTLEFGAPVYVDELWRSVQNVETPHNILFLAPWGAGKSTILDALELRAESSKRFEVVRVNAWKHGRESLRRKLILEVVAKLRPRSKESLKGRMYESVSGVRPYGARGAFSGLLGLIRAGTMALFALLITALFAGLSVYIKYHVLFSKEGWKAWGDAVAGLMQPPNLLVFLLTFLVSEMTAVYSRHDGHLELTHSEQYEELFKGAISLLGKRGKGERLLVVVDEVDRCSSEQVLETLETIKTFMNHRNCVFLVAGDYLRIDSALKKSVHADADVVNKVFETVVRMPEHSHHRLVAYAEKLLSKENIVQGHRQNITSELPPVIVGQLEAFAKAAVTAKVPELLVHRGIDTPRKVKRILNDFLVQCQLNIGDASWEQVDWVGLVRRTIMYSEYPAVAKLFDDYPGLPAWLCLIGDGAIEHLGPVEVQVCSVFFGTKKIDQYEEPDWELPLAEYRDLLEFIQVRTPAEPGSSLFLAGEVEAEALRAWVLGQARRGNSDTILAYIHDNESRRRRFIRWIITWFRTTSDAMSRGNLLLVAVRLGTSVPLDIRASLVKLVSNNFALLKSHSDFWEPVTVANTMSLLRDMVVPQAEQYRRMLLDDVEQNPEAKVPILLSDDILAELNVLALDLESRRRMISVIYTWVQTIDSDVVLRHHLEKLRGTLPPASTTMLSIIVSTVSRALGAGKSEGIVSSLRTWLGLFGTHLAKEHGGKLFEAVQPLFDNRDALPVDWLLVMAESWLRLISSEALPGAAEAVMRAHATPEDQIGFLDRVLRTHGPRATPSSSAFTGVLENASDLESVREFVHQWGQFLPRDALSRLQPHFVRRLVDCQSPVEFLQISAILKVVACGPGNEESAREYLNVVLSRMRESWSDSTWLDAIVNCLVSGPYRIPADLLPVVVDRCAEICFNSEVLTGQPQVLVHLSQVIRRIASVSLQAQWLMRIRSDVLADSNDSSLISGFEALEIMVESASHTVGAIRQELPVLLSFALVRHNRIFNQRLCRLISKLPVQVIATHESAIVDFFVARAALADALQAIDMMGTKLDPSTFVIGASQRYPLDSPESTTLVNWVIERSDRNSFTVKGLLQQIISNPKSRPFLYQVCYRVEKLRREIIQALVLKINSEPYTALEALHTLAELLPLTTTTERDQTVRAVLSAVSCGLSAEYGRGLLTTVMEQGVSNRSRRLIRGFITKSATPEPGTKGSIPVDQLTRKSRKTARKHVIPTSQGGESRLLRPTLLEQGQMSPGRLENVGPVKKRRRWVSELQSRKPR